MKKLLVIVMSAVLTTASFSADVKLKTSERPAKTVPYEGFNSDVQVMAHTLYGRQVELYINMALREFYPESTLAKGPLNLSPQMRSKITGRAYYLMNRDAKEIEEAARKERIAAIEAGSGKTRPRATDPAPTE